MRNTRIIIPQIPPLPGRGITIQNDNTPQIPRGVTEISIAFFICTAIMVIGWPIARALGRRIERRAAPGGLPAGLGDQLTRIEQAVDAMSIEVERISESQRFLARLQAESKQVAGS